MGLQGTHLHTQDTFAFRGKRLNNVSLEPAKHEGFQLLMQFLDFHFVIDIIEIKLIRERDLNQASQMKSFRL